MLIIIIRKNFVFVWLPWTILSYTVFSSLKQNYDVEIYFISNSCDFWLYYVLRTQQKGKPVGSGWFKRD